MRASRGAFVASSLAAVAAARGPASAQTPLPAVRVGVSAADTFAEAYFASDQGFFNRAGVSADVQTFTSGSAAANAVVGGSLDIGVTTPLLLANAHLRGVPLTIVAAGALQTRAFPNSVICVPKSSPIASAKDLVGKTVGVNVLKTVLELSVDAWLARNGVDASSVRKVEVTFAEMGAAIDRGTVGAAQISEPFLSEALKQNNVRVLADPMPDIAPRFLLAAWFTNQSFAQRNPEAVTRFAAAIYEAAKWANAHRPESAAILVRTAKLDPAVTGSMVRCEYADEMRLTDMQVLLDAAVKYNFLPKPVSASELVLSARR